MSDFIALAWRAEAESQALAIKAALAADVAWRQAVDASQMAVFLRRDRPLPLVRLPGLTGVVIGPVFDMAEALEGRGRVAEFIHLTGARPVELCRRLIESAWGSYVAILPDPDGAPNIFRDPLGGLECLTWSRDRVYVAASRLDPAGPHAPQRLSIDWTALGALLGDKSLSSALVPLHGVEGVLPGSLRMADGRQVPIWRPADFARRRAARPKTTPQDLATVIDGCVAAWSKGCSGVLCEVSGGLDSAIVLAALQRAKALVAGAIHHYWPQPEADERAFARAVAQGVGVDLTEQAHGLLHLDAEKLATVASAARPSFSAADPNYDADMAARLEALGADSLFTGQGGDAVFYQMAGAGLAGELMRGGLGLGARRRALGQLAHRTRRPAWSLLAEAMSRRQASISPPVPLSFRDAGAAPSGARHPWLGELKGVSPAKQAQIQALTNNQSMFGDSLRARAGRLIQPLMSQPVVELCLAIPAPMLAIGASDRPFARAAYEGRVPSSVLERRWKGDLSVFFAQSMAASLPFLRTFLLEGRLAAEGLIDPAKLEPILHRDELIWFDHSGELALTAILEAWVRHWEEACRSGASGGCPQLSSAGQA